jgi:mitochondrial fission protein ELM1
VKRLSGGRALTAYVQNPECGLKKFDLVAALPHDRVSGANVVVVGTALHPVTEAGLSHARLEWRERLDTSGAPLLGVLVGGDNASYRLTDAVLARLVGVLRRAHDEHGHAVAVTPSRRTGTKARRILQEAFGNEPWATVWTGEGDNPYLGILALSSRLIVTAESISMVSEALATGRPVHVLPLEGEGRRHDAFLARMVGEKLVSPIVADDLDWAFAGEAPINATAEPSRRIREMLARRGVVLGGRAA